MKRLIRWLLPLILIAGIAFGATRAADRVEPPREAVIYSQDPFDIRMIRAGDKKNPEYKIFGMLILCDRILDVRALTVYSAYDSTHIYGGPINRTLNLADTCSVEMYAFSIHGGALRKQLEKPGNAVIIVHGAQYGLTFELTAAGEEALLRVILKGEEI